MIKSMRLSSVHHDHFLTRHSESGRKRFRSFAARGHGKSREKVNTHPNHLVTIVRAYPILPVPEFPSMAVEDAGAPEASKTCDVATEEFTQKMPSTEAPGLGLSHDKSNISTHHAGEASPLEPYVTQTSGDTASLASIFQSPAAIIPDLDQLKEDHLQREVHSDEIGLVQTIEQSDSHIQTCEDELAKIQEQAPKLDPHAAPNTQAEPKSTNLSDEREAQEHAQKTAQISSHVAQIVTRISSLAERLGMRPEIADPKRSASSRPSQPTNTAPSSVPSLSPITSSAGLPAYSKLPKPMLINTTDSTTDVEPSRKMSYETEPLRINPIKKPDPVELQTPLPKANKTPIRFTVRKTSHEPAARQTSQGSNSLHLRGARTISVSSKELRSDADEESKEKMHSAKAKLKKLEASIESITAEIDYLKTCLPPHAPEPADYNDHMKIHEFINVLQTERDDLEKKRYDLGMYMTKLWGRKEDNRWVRNFSQ